jgi:hypothetical protein
VTGGGKLSRGKREKFLFEEDLMGRVERKRRRN